jgi:hypothetical protein
LSVPLRPFSSNGLPDFIITTCIAHHNRMAQPRMVAGCWVDAWLAHAMKQSAVMLVALTTSCILREAQCVATWRGGEQRHDAMWAATLALPFPPAPVYDESAAQV